MKSSVSIAGLDITGNVTLTISSGCMLTVTGANGVDCIATSWIYPSAGEASVIVLKPKNLSS